MVFQNDFQKLQKRLKSKVCTFIYLDRDKVKIKSALDRIDRNFQEVLIAAEASLQPAQQETSCERLCELKRERKYWRVLVFPKKSLTREVLRNHGVGEVKTI